MSYYAEKYTIFTFYSIPRHLEVHTSLLFHNSLESQFILAMTWLVFITHFYDQDNVLFLISIVIIGFFFAFCSTFGVFEAINKRVWCETDEKNN